MESEPDIINSISKEYGVDPLDTFYMEEVIETTVVYHGSKERILELAAMLGVNISNKNGDSIAPKIIGKDITKLSTAQDCRTERKEITSSSKEKEGYRIADIQGVCEPTDESCIKASDFYDSEKSIVTEDTGIEKSALEGTQKTPMSTGIKKKKRWRRIIPRSLIKSEKRESLSNSSKGSEGIHTIEEKKVINNKGRKKRKSIIPSSLLKRRTTLSNIGCINNSGIVSGLDCVFNRQTKKIVN
ncbi:uncharacterized protein LOC136039213 isoform X2 [Artemia franciscana]|uniref:uncharacterized protein LOC136039213 isoform X2 n=1 Tax=Artemia franciscana TaxID=6661 RepID=UPI0032D9E381